MLGAAQSFDPVAGLKLRTLPKGFDRGGHRSLVEDARNIMGNGGNQFPAAQGLHFGENEIGQASSDFGKRVAVEEKERGLPVAGAEVVERLAETQDLGLPASPVAFERAITL